MRLLASRLETLCDDGADRAKYAYQLVMDGGKSITPGGTCVVLERMSQASGTLGAMGKDHET